MSLDTLTMYLDDLIRMGFVSKQEGKDGKPYYKLTELGLKSGLRDFSN